MPNHFEQTMEYWRKTAKHDYDTMLILFKSKRYSDCLFFGHIVLEKILKALAVKNKQKHPPYTHNLLFLIKTAAIDLNANDQNLLDSVNDFNIRTRYPDEKLLFYKKATKSYTEKYLKKIVNLYKKICAILEEKK